MLVLRFLLNRPIGVMVALAAFLAISVLAWLHIPVSLLPNLQVPYITIAVKYPGRAPLDIEQNSLLPIREGMLTVNNLKDLESIATNEIGTITLRFEFGTNMDLAYIEVNEKMGRLAAILPSGLDRPLVMKSAASDIPVVHIQVIPQREEDLAAVSELAVSVLKRRLEQIDGVGLVDINGLQKKAIAIEIDEAKLEALKLTSTILAETIRSANIETGSISVRDGNYRYFLKIAPTLKTLRELNELPITLPGGGYMQLQKLVTIRLTTERQQGLHLFQNKQAIVLAVHKQQASRLPELMPKLQEAVSSLKQITRT